MSLELTVVDYIAGNSDLVVDTDLYVGKEPVGSPDECMVVLASPGYDSESGLEVRPIQVISKAVAHEDASELAYVAHDLLSNKPGFPDTIENTFYSEVLNAPFPLDQDERGRYIFISNYIIRKRGADSES